MSRCRPPPQAAECLSINRATCAAPRPAPYRPSVNRIRPSLSLSRLSAPLLFHPFRLKDVKSILEWAVSIVQLPAERRAHGWPYSPRATASPAPHQPGRLSKSAALALATTSCA
eukprot:6213945-Pleurochrysis_carterae.AAC.1